MTHKCMGMHLLCIDVPWSLHLSYQHPYETRIKHVINIDPGVSVH